MTIFAYCRVSTLDQSPQIQIDALKRVYPDAIIREEKTSGTKSSDQRPVLNLLLEMIQPGDKLIVWKLDRLGRNLRDLLKIVDYLEEKGASLEILAQKIDTQSASGKAFLSMLGVFAEFENNLRRERQKEGIEKAKREGRYTGRPESFDRNEIKRLIDADMRPCDIMRKTGISKASFYRIKKELAIS